MDFNLNDGYVCSWVENIEEREFLTEGKAILDMITLAEVGSDGFDFSLETALEVASDTLGKPVKHFDMLVMLGKAAMEVYGEL